MGKSEKLPRGVSLNNSKKSPYLARYKNKDINLYKSCKTLEEAIETRQAWEQEYGTPKSRMLDKRNLLGKKIGKLLVVEEVEKVGGHRMFKCLCDCGNEIITRGESLVSGSTKSCGCSRGEFVSKANKADITGQRFGKLVAIKRLNKQTKKSEWIWQCKCDCGNFTEATVELLRKGQKVQCEECFDRYLKEEGIQKAQAAMQENTIDGVQVLRYTDNPNKNNTTGYKGVTLNKRRGTYTAVLTVNKKVHTKTGFKTAADAYYNGRLVLEDEYLPPKEKREKLRKEYVEKLDLPVGVRPKYGKTGITFAATYKSNGKEYQKRFKTPEEAIAQRKAWIKEHGEPLSGNKPLEDLSGQRFGRLTVTKFAYKKKGNYYWECICDCGNVKVVQVSNLKSGSTVSCGCYLRDITSERTRADISGERFGKLTAIRPLDKKDKWGELLWELKCDCGNTTTANVNALRKGDKIQCESCRADFLKNENAETLRAGMLDRKIDDINVLKFTDKPNSNSKTGYKGVFYNKSSKTFVAHIKINGHTYYKRGFKDAASAYYNGRLVLEDEYLPPKDEIEELRKETVNYKNKEDD